MLYRGIDVDEETPVQYAGVYITRWRSEWGEPTMLFFGVPVDELHEHLDDPELDALATKSAAWAKREAEARALVEAARDDYLAPGQTVSESLRQLATQLSIEGWDDEWTGWLNTTAALIEKALIPFETPDA